MIQYLLCIISTWFNSDLDSPSLCHPVSVSFENFMRFIWKFHALFIHDSILHALFIHDSILTWTHQVSVTKSLFHLKVSCVIHTFSACIIHTWFLTWAHQVSVTKSLFHLQVSCMIHTWFNSDLDLPSLGFIRRYLISLCFIWRFKCWTPSIYIQVWNKFMFHFLPLFI